MRIALRIQYNGRDFYGWQFQQGLPTIQGHLENAIAKIADHPIQLTCAGRTDAGVHALNQIAHFDTEAKRVMRAWTMGTNSHLPDTIAVQWAQEVDDQFHARFSALSRAYRYVIYNKSIRPAFFSAGVTWHYDLLNVATMQQACHFLIGEHDFTSFRSSECESKTPMRRIHSLTVIRQGDFVIIDVEANAFLHHMVRNIVGTLMHIGAGFKEPEWIREVLFAKDRRQAAETAPAAGLCLRKVKYPAPYAFLEESIHPLNFLL